jgi:hypothetical protein
MTQAEPGSLLRSLSKAPFILISLLLCFAVFALLDCGTEYEHASQAWECWKASGDPMPWMHWFESAFWPDILPGILLCIVGFTVVGALVENIGKTDLA